MTTTLPIHTYLPNASAIAYGCMGLGGSWDNSPISAEDIKLAEGAIEACLEAEINFFDHADIYTFGKAEEVFGRILHGRPDLREKIYLQSKGAIRLDQNPPYYDFSKEWLLTTLDNTLSRLQVDYLDVWLLHRPDPLMDLEEMADIFSTIKEAGKVKHFGISNMNRHQIAYLQQALDTPFIVNQIELSLSRLDWLLEGVMFDHPEGEAVNFTSGTLEYCREHHIQIQSWGSMANGIFSGKPLQQESHAVQETTKLVAELAEKYETTLEGIVLAFIMRHPAKIQPVIGTTNPKRINNCMAATSVTLSRQDWYRLLISSYGKNLP
ncbi:MAG: aldo/keto reductase [Bacteroidota bacterium]